MTLLAQIFRVAFAVLPPALALVSAGESRTSPVERIPSKAVRSSAASSSAAWNELRTLGDSPPMRPMG